jgi:hypothetical protein
MNSDESLWEAIRSLWMKYCGISDEYRILKHRWHYLHDNKDSFSALPRLDKEDRIKGKSTFTLLDELVSTIDESFERRLNFKRTVVEDYTESLPYLQTFSLEDYSILERKIFELSNFVGLLKAAFFQRTVSKEITHVASGLPHSPERTIGNELFYIAADKVAKNYYNCFKIPYGKWDGFITFTPPITEGHFIGAFFRPTAFSKLFHMSMSEEQKYFVGAYMLIAHELGHSPMVELHKNDVDARTYTPSWMLLLFDIISTSTQAVTSRYRNSSCGTCTLTNRYVLKNEFEQCIADILGMMVAGPNIGHALLDTIYGASDVKDLIRLTTLYSYSSFSPFGVDRTLIDRIDDLGDRVNDSVNCPNFFDCVSEIGSYWANLINDFDQRFPEIFEDEMNSRTSSVNDLISLCPMSPILDLEIIEIIRRSQSWSNLYQICSAIASNEGRVLQCNRICEGSSSDSLFSHFIDDKFDVNNIEVEGENISVDDIKNYLTERIPCTEVDPRYILHAYYECYKESDGASRPDYVTP